MQTIIFKERSNGTCQYIGWVGSDSNKFIPMEVEMNINSYLDDMIVYLYIDVTGKDVDEVYEEYEENGYDTEKYESELNKLGFDYKYIDHKLSHVIEYQFMENKPYKLATITGYYDYTSSSAISYIQCIVNSAIQENVEFSIDDIREFLAKTKIEINGAVLKLVEVEMFDIDDVQG